MVTQESLSRIRTIVEGAYAHHFGAHQTELTLEPFVDHYGYHMVDVVFVFDEMPPRFGGREIVDFEGQVDDEMIEENLLIDTGFRYQLRAELDELMAEDER
ncbi:MAG: hypothetical protein F4123_04530 [Gemmatimonadetes bacterium]|nr:hypothetical protein [Gemmatimonadota bacterium]MYB97017.1 hypothetical protein [Gemmatimonadota bacterium]MYI45634.1 hypothetical protein [Gemmatimonadota bacterium]